jgi:hypothetical protein
MFFHFMIYLYHCYLILHNNNAYLIINENLKALLGLLTKKHKYFNFSWDVLCSTTHKGLIFSQFFSISPRACHDLARELHVNYKLQTQDDWRVQKCVIAKPSTLANFKTIDTRKCPVKLWLANVCLENVLQNCRCNSINISFVKFALLCVMPIVQC